jgi:hypothetical protein
MYFSKEAWVNPAILPSLTSFKIKQKKMKVSQTKKNLGESMAMSVVLVATSLGVFLVMAMQSGIFQ